MAGPTNSQRARTVQEFITSLSPADVLREAKIFFARQNGVYSAFVEQEGPNYITLRGMGGEEVAIGIAPVKETTPGEEVAIGIAPVKGTRVTASSYLFDQQIARFLSKLPPAPPASPPLPEQSASSASPAA
jgi:hypothetical protein